MSWTTLFIISGGAFFFKMAGTFGLGRYMTHPTTKSIGVLLPPALLAALVAIGTFSTDDSLVLDARAAGVGAGAFAVWRGAPFWVVVTVAAVVTGGLRAIAA